MFYTVYLTEKITTWGIITLKMLIDICFSYLVLLWSFFSAVNCKFLSNFTVNFNNTEIANYKIWSLSTWNAHSKEELNKSSVCAWLTLIKTKIGLQVGFCGCVFHFVYIMCVCVCVCACVCVWEAYLRQVLLSHTVSCLDRALRGKQTQTHTHTHTHRHYMNSIIATAIMAHTHLLVYCLMIH